MVLSVPRFGGYAEYVRERLRPVVEIRRETKQGNHRCERPFKILKELVTGTRVPRNSHSAAYLSGSRSTTEQLDQSNMVLRLSRLRQTNNLILDAFAHSSLRALNRCAVPFQCFLNLARQGRFA